MTPNTPAGICPTCGSLAHKWKHGDIRYDPLIRDQFSPEFLAEMQMKMQEADATREAQVSTEAGKRALRASRTVVTKDRTTLTILDADILDVIRAVETESLLQEPARRERRGRTGCG